MTSIQRLSRTMPRRHIVVRVTLPTPNLRTVLKIHPFLTKGWAVTTTPLQLQPRENAVRILEEALWASAPVYLFIYALIYLWLMKDCVSACVHVTGRSTRVESINKNSVQEEIKRRLKSGNDCYHSVQNLLSSNLLSKNLKIKTYKTLILPVVLYECEICSLH